VSGIDRNITDAALRCFGRYGMSKTTMEDVAREAGVSRATLYRQVPSKDALVQETVQAEAQRFLSAVQHATAGIDDVFELLALFLHAMARELETHEVLNRVLDTEPERILPQLSVNAGPVIALIESVIGPVVRDAIRSGRVRRSDEDATVEYVSRMLLSFSIQPSPTAGLSSLDNCRRIARQELLAGG